MNERARTVGIGAAGTRALAAALVALLAVAALGLAGCGGQQAASSAAPAASAATQAGSDTSELAPDTPDPGSYALQFNGYGYGDPFYAPGEPLTLKVSTVYADPDAADATDVADVKATYEWTVDEKLGATVDGDTLKVAAMPAPGEYQFSVKAIEDVSGEVASETHTIYVKEAPEFSMTIQKEEEGTTTDTCKAKDDYMRVLLEGLDWEWVNADGHSLSWQVKDVNTGAVYDENTGLLDLDAKANGGIEAEDFGNYDWPAMMATFNEPGEYEITATFRMANGGSTSASGVLRVK